jgi:hypothetical protein
LLSAFLTAAKAAIVPTNPFKREIGEREQIPASKEK